MKFTLTASMSDADYGHLNREVQELEIGGIDSFHIDIMDGRFVPNFAMSLNDMRCIAKAAKRPLDVHLMIEHPREQIDLFLEGLRPGDTVYIHPEAEYHPSTTLQKIIDAGMVPGIAMNPGTSVETVFEMLRIVDKVLVMTEYPGESYNSDFSYVSKKVTKLISLKEEMEFELMVEGIRDVTLMRELSYKGVDGFVADKDILFGTGRAYGETIDEIRGVYAKERAAMLVFKNKSAKVV